MRFAVAVVVLTSAVATKAAEDQATLQNILEQVQRMSQQLENQQKLIENQQKQINEQHKVITALTSRSPQSKVEKLVEKGEPATPAVKYGVPHHDESTAKISIGAVVDTAFRYFDGEAANRAERPAGNDFQLRAAEIFLAAEVDKDFASYIVLNTEPESDETDEAAIEVEEAAIYTLSLDPVKVKGGRFFVPFGRFSQVHTHSLPFVTRPRSLEAYVGGESRADGVQIGAKIPIDHPLHVTAGAFNKIGSEFPLFNGADDRRNGSELTYFGKLATQLKIGDAHTIDWSASTIQVPHHLIRRNLNNMELTYHWHPDECDTDDRLVWGTEIMRNEYRSRFVKNPDEVELGDDPILGRNSIAGWGGYTYAEYFYNKHWSFGPRVDLFQNTDASAESRPTYDQTYSLFLTYRFSEFSRLRAEFSRHEYFDGDQSNEFYLQWTVFWGAHNHEEDNRAHDHRHDHGHRSHDGHGHGDHKH
ncbi:MAG TPA: porin [Planctomycetota bacterium]|nr:porin [Planctomycetota bacterium]